MALREYIQMRQGVDDKKIIPPWENGLSFDYANFATKLLSDQPAYITVYRLVVDILNDILKIHNDPVTVLDFGCHNGSSTSFLASYLPPMPSGSKVYGVDNYEGVIGSAQEAYSGTNMEFRVVKTEEPIPDDILPDIEVLTFVTPTIEDAAALTWTMKKLYDALKPDGAIVILALNPDALNEKHEYISYEISGDQNLVYSGQKFENNLRLSPDNTLKLNDTYWTDDKILNTLRVVGFGLTDAFALTQDLGGPIGEYLVGALNQFNNVSWGDEWKGKGLFKIYIGIKTDIQQQSEKGNSLIGNNPLLEA